MYMYVCLRVYVCGHGGTACVQSLASGLMIAGLTMYRDGSVSAHGILILVASCTVLG